VEMCVYIKTRVVAAGHTKMAFTLVALCSLPQDGDSASMQVDVYIYVYRYRYVCMCMYIDRYRYRYRERVQLCNLPCDGDSASIRGDIYIYISVCVCMWRCVYEYQLEPLTLGTRRWRSRKQRNEALTLAHAQTIHYTSNSG